MEDRKEIYELKGKKDQSEKKGGNVFFTLVCLFLTLFTLWEISTLSLPPYMERVIFVTAGLVLCFLSYPFSRRIGRRWDLLVNLVLIVISTATCLYFIVVHDDLLFRLGAPTPGDMLAGTVLVILVLEATRRTVGWALPLVAIGALGYAFFGQFLPMLLGQHGGYEIERVITQTSLSTEGIYGVATAVMFSYVFLFIVFGNILSKAGGMEFIMDAARALFGHLAGGPAKIAVVSSGLTGTVSGSAVANVMITGTVTIPLMKRFGFKPYVAGAVEAVASSGGALMPPVMGAAAFIMAEYLSVPYISVAKAALLPAILYYLALFFAVHFYAKKNRLQGIPRKDLPNIWHVLKEKGYLFIAPLGTVIYLLVALYSPNKAVLYGILVTFIVSMASKTLRLGPVRAIEAFKKAAQDSIALICACACVGIIIAQVLTTGLGLKLPDLILQISGGSLLLTLILCMVSSLILGMGLPTTVCYILLATLVAPTLIKMGIAPMAAHMFIFYFGMLSMVTPPVAMAAYAGATIAGANIMTTGWMAWKLALVGFLLPYAFVYGPELLLMGELYSNIIAFITGLVGAFFLSVVVIGYLKKELSWGERVLFFAAACLLIKPGWITDLFGFILIVIGLLSHLHFRKRVRAQKR